MNGAHGENVFVKLQMGVVLVFKRQQESVQILILLVGERPAQDFLVVPRVVFQRNVVKELMVDGPGVFGVTAYVTILQERGPGLPLELVIILCRVAEVVSVLAAL